MPSERPKNIKDLIPNNVENERWYISYLLHINDNSESIDLVESDWFYDELCKNLHKTLIGLNDKTLKTDLDTVYDFCKRRVYRNLKRDELIEIYEDYKNFDNIKYVIETIKETHFKKQIGKDLEKIITHSLTNSDLDYSQLQELGESLTDNIFYLKEDNNLKAMDQLVDRYRDTLNRRERDDIYLSIGDPCLNKKIAKPGAPKEMTAIVGMRGTGKSMFAMGLEVGLIHHKIPVVAFDIEMSEESIMDRRICMLEDLPISALLEKEKSPELKDRIEKRLKKLESNPYFLSYNEPGISLKLIDKYLKKARRTFIQKKVIDRDGHFVVKIDLVDMIDEFDNADPPKIKANINNLHRMARKYNCHLILILQANENQLRGKSPFRDPDDCDYHFLKLADIEGGAAYAARCRVVISINRPLHLKKEYFSDRIDEWKEELDFVNIHGIKHNDGDLFFIQYVLCDNFRIYPLRRTRRKPVNS